jgi:predicted RNA binding protein YcfA (HicA-like mRNA interferase family)
MCPVYSVTHVPGSDPIRFEDLCGLLESLGFQKRVKGSHHIFRRSGVAALVNLQRAGFQAKPYQVKQVGAVILEAKLGIE